LIDFLHKGTWRIEHPLDASANETPWRNDEQEEVGVQVSIQREQPTKAT